MFRRRWKRLLITFGIFAFLIGGVVITLHSTAFHRHLLGVLKKSTGWEIRVGNSHFNFHRAKFTFDFVEILDPKGTFKMTGDRIFLDFSIVTFLRGRIAVTGLEVDRPVLYLQKDSSVSKPPLSLVQLSKILSQIPQSIWLQNISLKNVTLTNVSLEMEDQATHEIREGKASRIVLDAYPNVLREVHLQLLMEGSSGILPKAQSIELKGMIKDKAASVKSFRLDTGKLVLNAQADWTGFTGQGTLEAKGTLEAPTVLSEVLSFSLKSKTEETKAHLEKINAELGKAHLTGSGDVFYPESLKSMRYQIGFKATDLPLESIFQKINSTVVAPAKGIATVEGRAEGTLPALQVNAKAEIQNLEHGALRSRRLDGTIHFHWPELDFEADIKPGASERTEGHASGGIIFKHLPPYKSRKTMLKTLELNLKEGSLGDLVPNLGVLGKIDATLQLKGKPGTTSSEGSSKARISEAQWFLGPVDSLETEIKFEPDGRIFFTKTNFKDPRLAPIVWPDALVLDAENGIVAFEGKPMPGLSVKGTYIPKEDLFKVDSFAFNQEGSNLTGSLLRSKTAIEGKLRGVINLATLTLFPHYLREGRGNVQLDLGISGTTQNPIFKGYLDFSHNEISPRGYSAITDLTGRLSMDGTKVSPNLSGFLGDGRFKLGGSMTLEKGEPHNFDLTFEGRDLHYSKTNVYRVDLDANLTLKGSRPNPALAGRIDIVNLLYTKPFGLTEIVLSPFEEIQEESPWEPILNPVQLDLTIKNSGDLEVKNNIAHIFLIANLTVQGTYERPLVRGAINTTEGEIRLFGNDFIITEGRMDFIDPSRREPYMTLHTELDLPPEFTIFAEVKGFLSNLEVILTSTPSLSREDILSVITTGLTAEELRQSGQRRPGVGQSVLAGEITSILDQPIKKRTGLDIFRLEASESGSLSRLAVGKNVTDRLTVEFQSDFAPETAERLLQANYYLTDNILLKGSRAWETQTASTTPAYKLNASFRLRLD